MVPYHPTCPEGLGPGHLSPLALTVQGSPPPSSSHSHLLSPPLPSSFSWSHLQQPLPLLLFTSVLLDCPGSYLSSCSPFSPFRTKGKAGVGTSSRDSRPSPTLPALW